MDQPPFSTRQIFISRAGADKPLALWIAALLQAQGVSTILQDQDFPHADFMGAMHDAFTSGALTAALLSPAYLASDYCVKEANHALHGDPLNKLKRLRLLRIEHCPPTGMFASIAYTDLTPERRHNDATALAQKILHALDITDPKLDGLPPPPPGTLTSKVQLLHPEIRPTAHFTGREELLTTLDQGMQPRPGANSLQAIQAAAGMGGVGKTTLAREFAWRRRHNFEGVWWLDAETEDGLLQGLIELGDHLLPGLAQQEDRHAAAQKTLRWLETADYDPPFLLIYDNVDNLALVDRLRPRAQTHLLLTTRRTDLTGLVDSPVNVDLFAPDLAISFLCAQAGKDDRDGAARLAELLGGLPLALDQAAAYCRGNPLASFDLYADNIAKLLDRAPPQDAAAAYPRSVFATFTLALDAIIAGDKARNRPPCPEAEALMALIAVLAPAPIPLSLVEQEFDALTLGETVKRLADVSLLRRTDFDDGTPAITAHRLVQAAMRARLAVVEEPVATTLRLLADQWPNPARDPDNWPACQRLLPHINAVRPNAPTRGDGAQHTSRLLNNVGQYHDSRAAYAEAEPMMREALDIDRDSYGDRHPNVATGLNNLAQLLQDTNRLKEAEPMMREALDIDRDSYGDRHPDVATGPQQPGAAAQGHKPPRRGRADDARDRPPSATAITVAPQQPGAAVPGHKPARPSR